MQKAWYILSPLVIYSIVKSIAMVFITMVLPYMPIPGIAQWIEANTGLVSAVINAVASIAAVAFVGSDFLKEVVITGEVDIDANAFVRVLCWIKEGYQRNRQKGLQFGAIMSLAIASSLALNILLELLPLQSEKYNQVEEIQYAVPIWLGIILYGLVSPVVEEMVFRGLIYNRMKRFFSIGVSVVATAFMFGGFHANLIQGIYGTSMGILMALCYEWTGCFGGALLFHTTANLFVFLLSSLYGDKLFIVTPLNCIIFMTISILLLYFIYKKKGN